jgi:hypothetical protein
MKSSEKVGLSTQRAQIFLAFSRERVAPHKQTTDKSKKCRRAEHNGAKTAEKRRLRELLGNVHTPRLKNFHHRRRRRRRRAHDDIIYIIYIIIFKITT